jgi:hypothetical protein
MEDVLVCSGDVHRRAASAAAPGSSWCRWLAGVYCRASPDHEQPTRRRSSMTRRGSIIVVAFAVFALAAAGYVLLRSGSTPAPGPALQRLSQAVPGESLEDTARRMNEALPVMVDAQTRLDSTEAVGQAFHYNYTLLGAVDAADLDARLAPHLRRTVCANQQMRDFMAPGVSAVYTYLDDGGALLTRITVTLDDCARG